MRAVAVIVALLASACGSTEPAPNGPSPVPGPAPGPSPVLATPPQGVSAEVWRMAFGPDSRLYRPTSLYFTLAEGVDREKFLSAMATVQAAVEGKTPMAVVETAPAGDGAVFTVEVVESIPTCADSEHTTGCVTRSFHSSGRVVGGKMRLTPAISLRDLAHEIVHALGVGHSPALGLMYERGSSAPLTTEEKKALLGRYDYPLMSVYSGG